MRARLSIVLGLVTGIAAAALVLGGIFILAPEPVRSPSPPPLIAESIGPSPSPVASSTPTPSATVVVPTGSVAPSGPAASGAATGLFLIGEPAPALVVPQVGGGTINLENLKGKPVWVDFWATGCLRCADEFPLMNRFAIRYAKDDLVVLAIDFKEDEGTVVSFADGLNTTFPLGLDKDGAVTDRWKAAAVLPVHFWIDRDGIVRDGAAGGIGPDIMVRGLRSILPGVDVVP